MAFQGLDALVTACEVTEMTKFPHAETSKRGICEPIESSRIPIGEGSVGLSRPFELFAVEPWPSRKMREQKSENEIILKHHLNRIE